MDPLERQALMRRAQDLSARRQRAYPILQLVYDVAVVPQLRRGHTDLDRAQRAINRMSTTLARWDMPVAGLPTPNLNSWRRTLVQLRRSNSAVAVDDDEEVEIGAGVLWSYLGALLDRAPLVEESLATVFQTHAADDASVSALERLVSYLQIELDALSRQH